MSKDSLEKRMKDSPPELAAKQALDKGRAIAIASVTKTAFDMAKSGKESGMTQFWLQCRADWKKTEVREVSGRDGGPIETQNQGTVLILPEKDIPQD